MEYELALRARSGDREALARLVERTRVRLFAMAYADLRHYEDAQDAVAAALLQVCLHIGELREPGRIHAWMQSILRNEVRRLRRGPAETSLSDAEPGAAGDDLPLLRLDIERALRRLPGDQARAIRLYYLDDLSTREIAQRLERAEGTITSWLHRGRQLLAAMMEEYGPMTTRAKGTAPPANRSRIATVIHTDLDPALLQRVTAALQAAGYQVNVRTPDDVSRLAEELQGSQLIVLDEWVLGRPALELLVHLRASPETEEIPACVLCSEPSNFTVTAYFSAGLDRLVRKEDPDDIARIAGSIPEPAYTWKPFTLRARRVITLAREEAYRIDLGLVGTEHLLLGLIQEENLGNGILVHLGVSLKEIRGQIELQRVETRPGAKYVEQQLTARAQRVIALAYAEALAMKHNYIGAEHLLLGLLREGEGLAAKVLTQLGVDADRVRRAIPIVGEKWWTVLEAERHLEAARAAYHAFLAGG